MARAIREIVHRRQARTARTTLGVNDDLHASLDGGFPITVHPAIFLSRSTCPLCLALCRRPSLPVPLSISLRAARPAHVLNRPTLVHVNSGENRPV